MKKRTVRGVCCAVSVALLFILAACGGAAEPTPLPTLTVPTELSAAIPSISAATEIPPTSPTAVPSSTSTLVAEPIEPTITLAATAVAATLPSPDNATGQTTYAVVFVEPNDVLNVRSGPGVNFGIVGTVPPDARDVQMSGAGQLVSGSTWVPVQRGALTGWVNSRFLTQFVPGDAFCGDTAVLQLLDRLATAVANQDDALLAQLIHPERGLRVRLLWYERETWLDNQDLLSDATRYDWGAAAGSGEAIVGTPAEILLPRLQADLLAATEQACNEILQGGTAGLIVLPDAYQALNYYAFHRPGTEEFAGLNWGTWVAGVEFWQGQYYLSTLVHYQWEP